MSSLLAPTFFKSKRYVPLSWADKLKFRLSKKSEPCVLRGIHAYVQSGGQFGTFKPWCWRDVVKHVAKLQRRPNPSDMTWHAMMIDLLAHQPQQGLPALSKHLVHEISRAGSAVHDLWLTQLAAMTNDASYRLWYDVVVNGLLRCTTLRQHGVLSCVAAIPAASIEQTLETVASLLALAKELGMTTTRTQVMLDAFWRINPGTPFEGLTNYLPGIATFSSRELYLESIHRKWSELLPYLDSPDA